MKCNMKKVGWGALTGVCIGPTAGVYGELALGELVLGERS